MAMSTMPVEVSLGPWMMPMRLVLRFLLPVFVSYSGKSSRNSRNRSNAFCHCSINAEDSSRMRVLTLRSAIRRLQTTVFPKAVAALRMPQSCFKTAFAAAS